jgi:hypothetical protein
MTNLMLIIDDNINVIVDVCQDVKIDSNKLYDVYIVGYGDDVKDRWSGAYIEDQKYIQTIQYDNELTFDNLYEDILLKSKFEL